MISTFHVKLLGDFQVSHGDVALKDLGSGRLQSLLAFLLLHRAAPQPRSQIAFAFWPDSSEAHAHLSLRKTLHLLRRVLPDAESRLLVGNTTIQWRSEAPLVVDVADFEAALARASQSASPSQARVALQEAVQHYGGDLLPGCYDEWVIPERERLREAFLQGLERLISIFEHDGQYAEAITYAQRLLRHDPLREESYRQLMRLYAANGDRPAAIRVYNRCVTLLQRELGVEPGPATQELYTDLLPTHEALHPIISPYALMLPAQTTIFIGREKELASASALLRRPEVRLVTFTGAAGTGKTRLALELTSDLSSDYAEGVAFVPLAPVGQADLVVSAIAQALGVREVAGQPLIETLVDFLREKRMLLLLDNFEHVIKAAPTVAQLLAGCPNLNLLVTSRAVLHLRGEHEYVVPPLQLPDLNNLPWLEELAQYEAISLFVERAIETRPDFSLTNQNARAVAEICAQLDGLPLAIELVAARTKILSPQAILSRLAVEGGKLKLLVGGSLDLPARQQALRSAIAWSYDLLSAPEQALFRRLGVFAGGCTIEAAEAVASPDDLDILEGLGSLVDKSLLRQAEDAEGTPRSWMLETLREYALERLAESSQAEEMRHQHAGYYLALVETIEPNLHGPQQREALARLDTEHDNIRAALEWFARSSEITEGGLRLAALVTYFWLIRQHWSEGRQWLERFLGASVGPTPTRARALRGLGRLAGRQGDFEPALRFYEESLAIYQELGDKQGIASAQTGLGVVYISRGDYHTSRTLITDSLRLYREIEDRAGEAAALANLGWVAQETSDYPLAIEYEEAALVSVRDLGDRFMLIDLLNDLSWSLFRQGQYDRARATAEEMMAVAIELENKHGLQNARDKLALIAQQQGDVDLAIKMMEANLSLNREMGVRIGIAVTCNNLGYVHICGGRDLERARILLEESSSLCLEMGRKTASIHPAINLAHLALLQGNYEQAKTLLKRSLQIAFDVSARRPLAEGLEFLAWAYADRGQSERAARLFGSAEYLREVIGDPLRPNERPDYERSVALARQTMVEEDFDKAWSEGRSTPLDQAVSYALEEN
jgi:predicted ATPase/DNA-binding SARP family transcriptional activator/Tfp pilus assembly protein PilF